MLLKLILMPTASVKMLGNQRGRVELFFGLTLRTEEVRVADKTVEVIEFPIKKLLSPNDVIEYGKQASAAERWRNDWEATKAGASYRIEPTEAIEQQLL